MRICWIDEDGRHEERTVAGAMLYIIPPSIPHATRNDSELTTSIIAFGNCPFDANAPDRYPQLLF
jgi:uncharacterized RmlC-like cupin family protein